MFKIIFWRYRRYLGEETAMPYSRHQMYRTHFEEYSEKWQDYFAMKALRDDPAFAATQRRMTKALLDCAAKNGLSTIDSFDTLAATGSPRKLYVTWHMNEPGNRLIAELVARELK